MTLFFNGNFFNPTNFSSSYVSNYGNFLETKQKPTVHCLPYLDIICAMYNPTLFMHSAA